MRPPLLAGLVLGCLLAAAAGFFAYRVLVAPGAEYVPEIHLTDIDGNSHALSEWRGHPVLLNFWATWCAPCLTEIPMLIEAQREFRDTGLVILGPAVDEAEPVRRFRAERNLNYPVFPGTDAAIAAMEALGDTRGALPLSVFIAPDGRILARHAGILRRETLQEWLRPYR